jgi:hypothetical protein
MKLQFCIFSSILASALAAPAVVWKQSRRAEERFLHSSDDLSASKLLENVLGGESNESSLAAVVFLVGKGDDGSESLTELASSGKLPQTFGKYNDADGIYHHVSGIESTQTVVREASRAHTEHRVLEISLSEFNGKMASLEASSQVEMEVSENGMPAQSTSKRANRRARELAKANVLVVNVGAKEDTTAFDSAVVSAIDNDKIDAVVLSGVRSLSEVKRERYLMSSRRMNSMEEQGRRHLASRRRLEDQDQGDDAENGDNDNSDMSGVYYVSMTPNILAGILFGLLFVIIVFIGLSCMGSISGQDVYVSKQPSIGREA